VAAQALPFQDSFGWQAEAVLAGAEVGTQFPFFPAACPAGHGHDPSLQILRRRSASAGFDSGSLHAPFAQIRRRRSGSGTLRSFSFARSLSFSFASAESPMRGDEAILPSLPDSFSRGITRPGAESDECVGDAVLPVLQSEDEEPEAWLGEVFVVAAE